MTALPDSLSAWSGPLSLFPRELSLSLGPLLQRIAIAIGPLRNKSASMSGDVDGYDGLARRGSYERLLVSEWLLLDEDPDEFLRRAATHEHAFLKLERRDPGRTRRSVALFDAGPSQLGAPRIAQLASLIVLAGRAADAGVRFSWGVLQDDERALIDDLSLSSVRTFLRARTAYEVTQKDLTEWSARIAEENPLTPRPPPNTRDDLWLIGAEANLKIPSDHPSASLICSASRLTVADRLEPGTRLVDVLVESGTVSRRTTLDLPEAPQLARLLRDPFSVAVVAPVSAVHADGKSRTHVSAPEPHTPLLFSSDGRRLMLRCTNGNIVAYGIPNSPRAGFIHPVVYKREPNEQAIAVGWEERRLVVVGKREKTGSASGELRLSNCGKKGGRNRSVCLEGLVPGESSMLEAGPGLHPLIQVQPNDRDFEATRHFIDGNDQQFELIQPNYFRCVDRQRRTKTISQASQTGALLAVSTLSSSLFAVGVAPATRFERQVMLIGGGHAPSGPAHPQRLPLPVEGQGPIAAFFGYGRHLAHSVFGLLAIRIDERRFRIFFGERWSGKPSSVDASAAAIHKVIEITAPEHTTPVGVVVEPNAAEPALVVVDEDRTTISLLQRATNRSRHTRLPSTNSVIRRVSTCVTSGCIAWHTEAEEVFVYSLDRRAFLLRVLPPAVSAGASEKAAT